MIPGVALCRDLGVEQGCFNVDLDQIRKLFMFRIVLCTDEGYAPHCAVVILSTIMHCSAPADLHFVILTPGLSSPTASALRNMVTDHGAHLDIITVESDISGNLNLGRFGSGAIMRLYMDRYLPTQCKKALYLDCDLLVLSDISTLTRIDLCGRAIGAVTDLCSPDAYAKQSGRTPYCNTGVLMIDLELWREQAIGERALSYLQQATGGLRYPDQDALNQVLAGNWFSLDLSWNFQPAAYTALEKKFDYLANRHEELIGAVHRPKIVHFIGGVKPWHAECTHPLQDLFIYFSAFTPWPIDRIGLKASLPLNRRLRLAFKQPRQRRRRNMLMYQLPDRAVHQAQLIQNGETAK